jgi:hypothetical protein
MPDPAGPADEAAAKTADKQATKINLMTSFMLGISSSGPLGHSDAARRR